MEFQKLFSSCMLLNKLFGQVTQASGICNHWTGLLNSNFNALKTVFMLPDNIYLSVELHNTLKTCKDAAKRYVP